MHHSSAPHADLPLARDPSYWGMTATQLLGAFNDNLFKQIVLLLCLDYVREKGLEGDPWQMTAQALFAMPFVLFSGFAGWLSDRTSKRFIVVLSKIAEIGVMLAGMAAFLLAGGDSDTRLTLVLVVLALMATQSAFFGPPKYGILPELFRERDLPQVNGMVQMTTFVAIIFGMALAGFLKESFEGRLWMTSAVCVGIAIAGTLTSLAIRRTPVAHPGLVLQPASLAIHHETRKMLRGDRPLLAVLLISSLFWFLGGVVQQAVNAFGKLQLKLGDGRTSLMLAFVGVGIAVGCIAVGRASRQKVRFGIVRAGSVGMVACLAGLALLGAAAGRAGVSPADQSATEGNGMYSAAGAEDQPLAAGDAGDPSPETFWALLVPRSLTETLARVLLTGVGFFAGLFIVPLQVFMQARPPDDQKGRMIGAMNLVNWIGIVLAAFFYGGVSAAFAAPAGTESDVPLSWIFAVLAALLLPVAAFYRPADVVLGDHS